LRHLIEIIILLLCQSLYACSLLIVWGSVAEKCPAHLSSNKFLSRGVEYCFRKMKSLIEK
jgi:hypothetical protein